MPTSITVAPGFEVASDHSGAADGCNQNVGAAAHTRKIASFRVANSDRGVAVDQQHGNRLADDIAASHHHGFLASDRNATPFENLDDSGGGARHQARPLR